MENGKVKTADCGSRYWMNRYAEEENVRRKFEKEIGESLEFISPKEGCEQNILETADCISWTEDQVEIWKRFWPERQPLWDGMAYGRQTKSLYFMEAKSHVREYRSSMHCQDADKKQQILSIMQDEYQRYFGNMKLPENNAWTELYYQLGVRLAFYHKAKEMVETAERQYAPIYWENREKTEKSPIHYVKFLLINFVDDEMLNVGRSGRARYRTDLDGFLETVPAVFVKLTGSEYPEKDIRVLNFNVAGLVPCRVPLT